MKDIDTYFIIFFFLSLSVVSDSLQPYGLYSPWTSPGQNTGPGRRKSYPSPRDLPNPGTEPRSPGSKVDFFTSWAQGKLKSTRVGSLSLLQWIFQGQELNWGLPHCRQILYQLSYQGSPTCENVEIIIVKVMGSNRNLCLSWAVLEINFLTTERGILVVCVVVAVRVRVCSTTRRQEWVTTSWCHLEKGKFVLQNSLLLTDLYGTHPSRVMGPTLFYTWRIWPVAALHLVL